MNVIDQIVELAAQIKYHRDEAQRLEDQLRSLVEERSSKKEPKKTAKPAVTTALKLDIAAALGKGGEPMTANEIREEVKKNYVTVKAALVEMEARDRTVQSFRAPRGRRTVTLWSLKKA